MFEKLEVIRMAQAMASNAGARMGAIAGNIANADTPGYKARDVADFASTYASGEGEGEGAMRATRPGHFGAGAQDAAPVPVIRRGATSPDGNSVSLEREMVKAAEVRTQHDMALSIYRASGDIVRAALGRGR